jgi:hypothetical protein
VGDGGQQVALEPVALLELADQGLLALDQPGLLGRGRLGPLGRGLGHGPPPVGPDGPPAGQVDGRGGQAEDREQAQAGLGDHRDHRRHTQQHGRHPGPHAHPLAGPVQRRGASGQHQHRLHQQVVDHEEGKGGGREGGQRHLGLVGVAAGQ